VNDPKSLMKERIEMFDNVYNFKHNQRIPLGCNIWSWQVLDCGYKQSEALENYDIAEKINREFHERYHFDAYTNLITRNPKRITDLLGGGAHYIDATDEIIQCDDHGCMEPDEYSELIKDPRAFYWTKAFPRYTHYQDENFVLTEGNLKQAIQEWSDFGSYSNKMLDMNFNEFGALMYYCQFCQVPFEHIMTNLRGIVGTSRDLRRKKKEILDTIAADEQITMDNVERAIKMDSTGYVAPITMVFLSHSILNPKQFEQFYYPTLKKIIDCAVANQKRMYLFIESTMMRFVDFFRDVPKGTMMIHLEQDDIFEFRKQLPNIAVAGGMPTTLLGPGSKQECIDYAKKLIDGLGEGYVFCQNKMVSYRNDCSRENLLAVNEFVRNYQY